MGPDFPSLADEITEPRPDMNIKVTAFTASKKFYYIGLYEALCVQNFFKFSYPLLKSVDRDQLAFAEAS